jgi:hypothetical protein
MRVNSARDPGLVTSARGYPSAERYRIKRDLFQYAHPECKGPDC